MLGQSCSGGTGNGMLGSLELHIPPLRGRDPLGENRAKVLRMAPRGADYKSIQAAVDAAEPGAEIVVEDGTYTESIWIARPG